MKKIPLLDKKVSDKMMPSFVGLRMLKVLYLVTASALRSHDKSLFWWREDKKSAVFTEGINMAKDKF